MTTHRNLRAPFLALVTMLIISTSGFTQIREKQLSSTYTNEVMKRDGTVAMTGALAMGSQKITGMADGTSAGDAATKGQLDAVASGIQTRESVRATSQDAPLDDSADITGSPAYVATDGASARGQITATLAVSGTFAVDGVTLVSTDRLLVSGEGAGQAEIMSVDTVADVGGDLQVQYFVIYKNASTAYYVWYNVQGGGSDPAPSPPAGVTWTPIEVAISVGATANTVATNTKTSLDAGTDFTTVISTNGLTITNALGGNITDVADSAATTAFTFGTDTQGVGMASDANGIYVVTIAGTSLTLDRSLDFDEDSEVVAGSLTLVEGGSVHEGHQHILTTSNPITVGGAGGTDQVWSMFSSLNLGTVVEITTVNGGDVAAAGTSGNAAHADHEHAVATAAAGAIQPDDAAAEGSSTDLSRADHSHSIVSGLAGTINPDDAAAEGSSTGFSRDDHQHAIAAAAASASVDAGDSSTEGSSVSFSRADHQHAVSTAAPSAAQTPDQANAEGSATTLARSDHTHNIPASIAIAVTTASGEGTDSSFARSDHEHDSPQMNDSNKLEVASVTTGTNETTGLTIASAPALSSQPWIVLNTLVYGVGDGVDTSHFYYSGDACTTPRALSAVAASDVLCQGDALPFNLDATDRISQNYLTFTNN